LNELLPERLNIVSMPVLFQDQNHCFDRELMKDCCVRCEIQIAFFSFFLILLLYSLFFFLLLAFESIIENSNFFFEAMIFLFPVSHNLDVQFHVAFFRSRGVCFMRFFLSKSYSWVTYERLGFLGLERHQ